MNTPHLETTRRGPMRSVPCRSAPSTSAKAWLGAAAVAVVGAVGAALASPAAAQVTQPYEGYLCCSMYMERDWIVELTFNAPGRKLVPAGTPVRFVRLRSWSIDVEIAGQRVGIFNDYSRDVDMDRFAARYVVRSDPREALRALPPKIREPILAGKVTRNMTREQVVMALGHPSTDYTPDTDKPLWHYWSDHDLEFQVFWTEDWRVAQLFGAPEARARVWAE